VAFGSHVVGGGSIQATADERLCDQRTVCTGVGYAIGLSLDVCRSQPCPHYGKATGSTFRACVGAHCPGSHKVDSTSPHTLANHNALSLATMSIARDFIDRARQHLDRSPLFPRYPR
jgi:hypothetical protein